MNKNTTFKSVDERRELVLPGDYSATLDYCVENFIEIANRAIDDHGYFAVALSGGSTPKAIFKTLALPENQARVDWKKCLVFWSDERSVAPDNEESNFHMAMTSGLSDLPINKSQLFRMIAENEIEKHAQEYSLLIESKIPQKKFDLMMLGMGDDGHTASLFPHTKALHVNNTLAVANEVPQKNTWRMSLTYNCINEAAHIVIYVLGHGKEKALKEVLYGTPNPDKYPAQLVGTKENKALWIVDDQAAQQIKGL